MLCSEFQLEDFSGVLLFLSYVLFFLNLLCFSFIVVFLSCLVSPCAEPRVHSSVFGQSCSAKLYDIFRFFLIFALLPFCVLSRVLFPL